MKKTYPIIPVDHPNYKWTSGADVQATWRRFGWTPPFGNKHEPIQHKEPVIVQETRKYWRVK